MSCLKHSESSEHLCSLCKHIDIATSKVPCLDCFAGDTCAFALSHRTDESARRYIKQTAARRNQKYFADSRNYLDVEQGV